MTDLAKLVVKLEAQTAQYQQGLERAQKQLSRFNRESSISAASIGKGIAAAATVAATALTFMAKAAIDNADRLNLLSQSTGVSTEALSQFEYAAQMSGVSSELLTKSLTKLSKNALAAAKDGGAAAESFEQLGISVQNADGTMRPTEDLLLDLAEKFSKMKDGAAKTGLAMEIFGKSGAALIPFLNEGKAGLAALTKEAEQLGLTVSGPAAAAADQFNDNLDRMKFAAKGVVNQAVQQLLPTFVAISERFVESAKAGGGLDVAIKILVGTFKVLVTAGALISGVFEKLGRLVYGVAAAIVRVATGEFRLAGDEIRDTFNDMSNSAAEEAEFIKKLWADTVPAMADTAAAIDEELEDTIIFNPNKAADKAQQAADAAMSSLEQMAKDMEQQVAVFGMSEEAAIRYRVAHGDLAKTIAEAGPGAQAYGDQIVALTDKMVGLEATAAAVKKTQEDWAQVQEKGKEITESVITPIETYRARMDELKEALDLGVISQETYSRAIENAREAFESAEDAGTTFMEQASKNVQDILAGYLEDPFSSSLEDLVADFGKMLSQMAAQAIAADIAGKIFGTGGVGSGGGWLGQLGGMAMSFLGGMGGGGAMSGLGDIAITAQRIPVGGGMASGGPVHAGTAYRVGDQGKAEWFVPESRGKIEADRGGGSNMTVHQNFSVPAPGGTVSRSTEQQIAAAASRGLAMASRRNN